MDPSPSLPTDFDQEMATTRKVLSRLPDEKLDWRPHPKSMTLGELASHLANLLHWGAVALQTEDFDLGAVPPTLEAYESGEEILAAFDGNLAEVRGLLAHAHDERLDAPWTLRKGEETVLQMPRRAVLRTFVLSHAIHHRGQMTVYLRLCDLPVPSVYGRSADEG